MKNNIKMLMYISIVSIGVFNSCRKTEVEEPEFDVFPSKTTVNVGDTLNFKITGNPDLLVFYSGEADHEYQYNKRTQIPGGQITLDFSTTNAVQTTQTDGFTVLVSTDYTGVNSVAAINAATWTNITSQVNLSKDATTVASGSVDMNQYVNTEDMNKPLFVAFRYNVIGGPGQGTWVVKSFDIKNTNSSRGFNIADIGTAGWIATSVTNPALNWSIQPTELIITGRISVPVDAEDWIITKPIYINRISPDLGLTIKDMSAQLSQFNYAFEEPGKYLVTFVASNTNRNSQKEKIKQITITVN